MAPRTLPPVLTITPAPYPHLPDAENPIHASDSPLSMLTTDPLLTQFVLDLQRLRHDLLREPDIDRTLRFSRAGIAAVRAQFAAMIRHGEADLHRLAQLLCASFLGAFQVESVVIGAVATTDERFTLTQTIAASDVYSTTDLDLGTRQLQKLRMFDGKHWSAANLVANMVEYQPTEPNAFGIYRITTRIKAEEAIWNKVVDELFDLDRLVQQDKALRHLSRYVKDVFGIKIVVGEIADVHRMQMAIRDQCWTDRDLAAQRIEAADKTRRLQWLEVKEYLESGHAKVSGWEAIKSVVRWNGKTFELQIQPLRSFLGERERLTRESHVSFKAQRERVRQQVAEHVPLFRFYGELLRWLFLDPQSPPPEYPHVRLVLEA
jgi:hypothetical protein